jgi:signal transduction histidine kinase/CheY-like chemotaxis protein
VRAPSQPENGVLPSDREEMIRDDAVAQMYRGLPAILVNLTLMPVVVGCVMWGSVRDIELIGWVVFTLGVVLLRYQLARIYVRRSARAGDGRRWADYFTITSVLSGLGWGYAGVEFFVPGAVAEQVFLYVSLVGLGAGSLIATSYWLPAYFGFVVPSLAAAIVQLALQDGPAYKGLAALLLMYFVILTRVALRQGRAVREVLRLRFENRDLVEELRRQKDMAEESRDVAEEAKTRAEQANIGKSKFLAAASHDLRQPLHALGLLIGALKYRLAGADTGAILESIDRSLVSLDSLLNAQLDVSKLDAGVVRPQLRDIALDALLAQLAEEYEPQARAKGLAWECSEQRFVVRTDPILLGTMLRNLIGNAIRYTDAGSVRVVCASRGDAVELEVVDSGIGIPAEHHQDVFGEFYQLHNPERDRTKGLGLGLAIVDRLSKLLALPLALRSAPGAGTSFCVTVPLGDADACVAAPASDADLAGAGEHDKGFVLVIDDERAICDAMALLIRGWGYEVLAIESAAEALRALARLPDAIIADYRLRDDKTGAEAVAAIRDAWGSRIPALIVTGDTAPERLRQAKESGFALLHKPVPPARLGAFLRNAIRGARA